jgi:hypothetical protein
MWKTSLPPGAVALISSVSEISHLASGHDQLHCYGAPERALAEYRLPIEGLLWSGLTGPATPTPKPCSYEASSHLNMSLQNGMVFRAL